MEEIHASEIASGSATFFHGNVYWLALINSGEHKNRSIIAFSLREEKFQEMELPISRPREPVSYLKVIYMVEHIYDVCSSCGKIWMTEECDIFVCIVMRCG